MKESPEWYAVAVTAGPDAAEALEYAFNSLEALGTEINYLQHKNTERVTVVGYFNVVPDEDSVQDELHYALRAYDLNDETIVQIERSKIEETDWLAEWKKHWKPTEVGGFVIAPSWSELSDDSKIVIRIEPNMAFGTGTHETTQLCLRAIEKEYVPGDSFIDVGTGTGILLIAAVKLNLKSQALDLKFEISDARPQISNLKSRISDFKLYGCDTDDEAVAIAKENAVLNGVNEFVEFGTGSITDNDQIYDFVCANLTLDVIKPLLPTLLAKAGKTLVLSGILVEQKADIIEALKDVGIKDPEFSQAGEWISVVVATGDQN